MDCRKWRGHVYKSESSPPHATFHSQYETFNKFDDLLKVIDLYIIQENKKLRTYHVLNYST